MKIIKINLNENYCEALEEACRILKLGGTVVYPTDTVYGLGANACDDLAVNSVFKIKRRSSRKPLPVIARNMQWVDGLAYVTPVQRKILEAVWPGPVTVVLPRREPLSSLVTAGGLSVGLRIPDFSLTDKLLECLGYPLTATSANISGEEPTNDINEIIEKFGGENGCSPTLVLDAGILPESKPSTVLDLTGDHPRILRVGPSNLQEFLKLLKV